MEPVSKKYFSISEVAEVTGIPHHKLRYFEKSNSNINVYQIRGRRYYTKDDIELIKQNLTSDSQLTFRIPSSETSDSNIISQIDILISKFNKLEEELNLTN